MGAPNKYHPGIIEIVAGLARQGLLLGEIAKSLRVNPGTLIKWRRQQPELQAVLDQGMESANAQVENALFKSACGYWVEEDVLSKAGDVKRIKRWIYPQIVAQIFWLKNRGADRWRDNPEGAGQMPTGPLLQITMNDNRVLSAPGAGSEVQLSPGSVEVKQDAEASDEPIQAG